MLVVAMISFSLFQFVGNPVNNMLGPEATSRTAARAAREALGLNDSRFLSSSPSGSAMPYRASSGNPIAWAARSTP